MGYRAGAVFSYLVSGSTVSGAATRISTFFNLAFKLIRNAKSSVVERNYLILAPNPTPSGVLIVFEFMLLVNINV